MKKIPTDRHITYQQQYRKCGKPTCSTCREGQGHGPYWYAYWREGSRLYSSYVGKTRPEGAVSREESTPRKLRRKKARKRAAACSTVLQAAASSALQEEALNPSQQELEPAAVLL